MWTPPQGSPVGSMLIALMPTDIPQEDKRVKFQSKSYEGVLPPQGTIALLNLLLQQAGLANAPWQSEPINNLAIGRIETFAGWLARQNVINTNGPSSPTPPQISNTVFGVF